MTSKSAFTNGAKDDVNYLIQLHWQVWRLEVEGYELTSGIPEDLKLNVTLPVDYYSWLLSRSPDLVKFRRFDKILKFFRVSIWQNFEPSMVYFLKHLGKFHDQIWQKNSPLRQNFEGFLRSFKEFGEILNLIWYIFEAIGLIFLFANCQIGTNNLAIS